VDVPGEGDFEPGRSAAAGALVDDLRRYLEELAAREAVEARTESGAAVAARWKINEMAEHGERVFDVILVEPDEWWCGWHLAYSLPRRWPGGTPIFDLGAPVISRAYWKLAEALAWSRLPIRSGQWCVELGAAPGGACQLLLEKGLKVIAVDPAELDARISSNPNLMHIRCRSREVRRAKLKNVRWLFADLNVAPNYTLDTVGDIVAHPKTQIQGLLLTLKMMTWDLADDIPKFVARVREWGFESVHVRQLAFNRREVCLAASRAKL
jgi:23S rRNA (cytidine2498-2'-O)-methyltransferase